MLDNREKMKLLLWINYLLVLILISQPIVSLAAQPFTIYGVTIHLKNNDSLDGYVETDVEMYKCNEKRDDKTPWILTWESFLGNQGTATFINKLIEVEYIRFNEGKFRNIRSLVAAKSSIREIDLPDIKSIKSVCRKWEGHESFAGVPRITDHMAEIIFSHKFIASYLYNDYEIAKDSGTSCGLCSSETIFLSYNPKYTRKELGKLRYKFYRMSDGELEKEKVVRFGQAWD